MTSIVTNSETSSRPRQATASRTRDAWQRALTLAGLMLALAVVSVGTWLIVDRTAGRGANPVSAATALPGWTPITSTWLDRLAVIRAKKQLVRAGYSIKVDGNLDPVTKSALADYLRLDSSHPLDPNLAAALQGTWITGLHNPAAWNSHFGLHRLTKFVERPLTGPGGQLDANGNVRASIPTPRAPQHKVGVDH